MFCLASSMVTVVDATAGVAASVPVSAIAVAGVEDSMESAGATASEAVAVAEVSSPVSGVVVSEAATVVAGFFSSSS
jgi:hypothetical protein